MPDQSPVSENPPFTDEQPGAYALLGLIEHAGGSSHGYVLLQEFAPGKPLADIVQLNPSMLYHLLKRLSARGWIVLERREGGPPRTRQQCRITKDGRQELSRWYQSPVLHTRELRLEFLLKLALARMLNSDSIPALVNAQIELCHAWRESMIEEIGRLDDAAFKSMVLSLRLNQTKAACRWLEEIRSAEHVEH